MTPWSSLLSRMMPVDDPPWETAASSFCRQATVAPSSSAESAAGTPPVPAPTTTTS